MDPPDMVPPVNNMLWYVISKAEGDRSDHTHRILGKELFPPSHVKPRRSLAVVFWRCAMGSAVVGTAPRIALRAVAAIRLRKCIF